MGNISENIIVEENFEGGSPLAPYTTSGTVTAETVNNSIKVKIVNDGYFEDSFTPPAVPYIVELDTMNEAGDTEIVELLTSGDAMLARITRGDTTNQLDFETDDVAASSVTATDTDYRKNVLYVDPVGLTITCYTNVNTETEGNGPYEIVGAAKAYSGTIAKIRVRGLSGGTVYCDEYRVYTPEVALIGDSIMDGKVTWSDHPEYIVGRLNATEDPTSPPTYHLGVDLGGVATHRVGGRAFGSATTTSVDNNIQAMVLDQGFNTVVVGAGHNDIVNAVAYATTKTKIESIITSCNSAGINVVLCSVPPASDINTDLEISIRDAYNVWLEERAQEEGYMFADCYGVLVDSSDSDALTAGYDSGDGIHLNSAGSAVMAQEIYDAVMGTLPDEDIRMFEDPGANNERIRDPDFEGASSGGVIIIRRRRGI